MGNNILRLTLLSMKDGSISYPTPYVGETEERFQFKNWIRFIKLNPAFRPSWDLNPWPLNFIYLKSLFITWKVYLDPTNWPAPSWLVSSVGRALYQYCRGHGFKSCMGLNFFQVLFSTTSSVVFLAVWIS